MLDAKELKLGFVGLGQATSKLLSRRSEIESLPYRITAGCDLRAHALDAFRREFGGGAFDDVEEMCRRSEVDVVYIATPPEYHREHVEIAARHGKHVIVEKPMALSLADCEAMIAAADAAGIKMLAGHTHSFDAPIRKMREIICAGELGELVMINTWNYNEFNHRGRLSHELKITRGPIFNQGPHQVDVVRQLGGGLVKTVKAKAIQDSLSGCEGGYTCFLEFENGVPATLVYDGRSLFDTAELFWWIGEGGQPRDPDLNAKRRKVYRRVKSLGGKATEQALEEFKEAGRYGAPENPSAGEEDKTQHQPFFGLTVVSCDHGTMRQSPDGLLIYGEDGPRELPLAKEIHGRAAELNELYQGIIGGRPIFHDGRWAMATLEVCMAIADSVHESREVRMTRQVPTNDAA